MSQASVRRLRAPGQYLHAAETRPRRPKSLNGLRPGVLENSKHNAQLLMEMIVEGLRGQAELGPLTVGHKGVTLPPSQETIELLKQNCDFVLVGTGDCGSCTAWTVRAAVMLEEAGVPTVGIGSDVFEEQFRTEAAQAGMAGMCSSHRSASSLGGACATPWSRKKAAGRRRPDRDRKSRPAGRARRR